MSLTAAPPVDVTAPARPHRLVLMRALLALLLALSGSIAITVLASGTAHAASGRLTDFDTRMLVLVNKARAAAGVGEVKPATGLTDLSVMWSSKMADGATANKLEHNPNAFEQTLSYGASNRTAWAENVAKWSPTSTSADEVFNAYMASPGHKANILGSRYAYIGIGSVTGSNGASWNTMTFTDKVEAGQVSKPVGSIDSVTVSKATIKVVGWAYDPMTSAASIPVHVYVNGVGYAFTADGARADVNSVMKVSGAHGVTATMPAKVGANQVCIYALSVTGGENATLSCTSVTWTPPQVPVGNLEGVSLSNGDLTVGGWAYDPNSSATSIAVRVYVNGGFAGELQANRARSDVNSVMKVSGDHGFTGSVRAVNGNNQVCVYAISLIDADNTTLGCTTVSNAVVPPNGNLDVVSRSGSTVRVAGWAYDPRSSSTSIPVHVYVNGVGTALTANGARNDVNSAFGISGGHGFDNAVSAPAGATVCVYGISVTNGGNTTLGCRTL